jgi:hypothetical protein
LIVLDLSTGFVYRWGVDSSGSLVLPLAVVTGREGGARLLEVAEVEGVLVERDGGAEVDLGDLVAVFGLPALAAA